MRERHPVRGVEPGASDSAFAVGLSQARRHACAGVPTNGTPSSSSTAWTEPFSPSPPCSAMRRRPAGWSGVARRGGVDVPLPAPRRLPRRERWRAAARTAGTPRVEWRGLRQQQPQFVRSRPHSAARRSQAPSRLDPLAGTGEDGGRWARGCGRTSAGRGRPGVQRRVLQEPPGRSRLHKRPQPAGTGRPPRVRRTRGGTVARLRARRRTAHRRLAGASVRAVAKRPRAGAIRPRRDGGVTSGLRPFRGRVDRRRALQGQSGSADGCPGGPRRPAPASPLGLAMGRRLVRVADRRGSTWRPVSRG